MKRSDYLPFGDDSAAPLVLTRRQRENASMYASALEARLAEAMPEYLHTRMTEAIRPRAGKRFDGLKNNGESADAGTNWARAAVASGEMPGGRGNAALRKKWTTPRRGKAFHINRD